MNAASKTDAAQGPMTARKKRKPRISRWLWSPLYAKLWWVSAVVYWTGFALSFPITPLRMIYESTFAGYLNVALYPPVILMILGLGFVRAKIARGDWVFVAGDPKTDQTNRSVSESLDPYTDPLDPKSGSSYVGSPESLAQLFGRKWP